MYIILVRFKNQLLTLHGHFPIFAPVTPFPLYNYVHPSVPILHPCAPLSTPLCPPRYTPAPPPVVFRKLVNRFLSLNGGISKTLKMSFKSSKNWVKNGFKTLILLLDFNRKDIIFDNSVY